MDLCLDPLPRWLLRTRPPLGVLGRGRGALRGTWWERRADGSQKCPF